MNLDGSDIEKILTLEDEYTESPCVIDNALYYVDDSELYKMSIDERKKTLIASDVYAYCIEDDWIFFTSDPYGYGRQLSKIKTDGSGLALLNEVDYGSDLYGVFQGWIYFQSYPPIRIDTNGTVDEFCKSWMPAQEFSEDESPEDGVSESAASGVSTQRPVRGSGWENEVSGEPFRWSTPVVENDDYIFYSSVNKIKRVDKKTGAVITLRERDKGEELPSIRLYLADNLLYIIDDGSLYSADYSGGNIKEIISWRWIQKVFFEEKISGVWDVTVFNNKIYLWCGGMDMLQYDPVKKEAKRIAYTAGSYCIFDNMLYYVPHRGGDMCKVDLETLKETIVRKDRPFREKGDTSDNEYYRLSGVFVYDNELYYDYRKNIDTYQIKRYDKAGNDEIVFTFPYGSGIVPGAGGIYYTEEGRNGKDYLCKYDPATKSTTSMLLPEDYLDYGGVVGDKFFYRSTLEEDREAFYYAVDLALK